MKTYFITATLILFFLGTSLNILAQNTAGQTNDLGRISIAAYVPPQIEGMPEAAKSILQNKLNEIVTKNGLGSGSMNSGFIITSNVAILTKDLLGTAPPMTAMNLEVTLYIGDGYTGTKYASKSVAVKGVGTNETKAYIEAIKQIKPSDPDIQQFVDAGKTKVLEYYNYKCDVIIKEAEVLAGQRKYEEAIYRLTAVPEVCKDCYEKCMNSVQPVYLKYVERQCRLGMEEAKNAWATSPNAKGAAAVASVLATIDPEASCYREATALRQEVAKKMYEIDRREWDFKLKVQSESVALEKQRVGAYRDVAMAFCKGLSNVTYNIRGWW